MLFKIPSLPLCPPYLPAFSPCVEILLRNLIEMFFLNVIRVCCVVPKTGLGGLYCCVYRVLHITMKILNDIRGLLRRGLNSVVIWLERKDGIVFAD